MEAEKVLRVLFVAVLVAGCSATGEDDGDVTEVDTSGACVEGLTGCDGQRFQVCRGGAWAVETTCEAPRMCVPGEGCAEVDEDCAEGTNLIYVVDSDYRLLSFDPADNTFQHIGRVVCPAGPSWPDWGQRDATPFSMSVDRTGRAWVLFTSGEVFWVDVRDAACRSSGFEAGQQGFQLFGMGFVSDAPGSSRETLYVAGGRVGALGGGTLGSVDPSTLELSRIGALPPTEFGAELTGNANAELFGYFPGQDTRVTRIDKGSGGADTSWSLPPFAGQPTAWAFAHWGGRYFVFITTRDGNDENERVLRFNPEDGQTETILERTGHRIVGAGVSTCAPTDANF